MTGNLEAWMNLILLAVVVGATAYFVYRMTRPKSSEPKEIYDLPRASRTPQAPPPDDNPIVPRKITVVEAVPPEFISPEPLSPRKSFRKTVAGTTKNR